MTVGSIAVWGQYEECRADEMTYSIVAEGFDWGTSVTKVVVNVGSELEDKIVSDVKKVHVNVNKTYLGTDTIAKEMDYSTGEYVDAWSAKGEREVKGVYGADEDGVPSEENEGYLTFEMNVGPEEGYGDVLGTEIETGLNHSTVLDCHYTVTFEDADGNEYVCDQENENSTYGLADLFTHNQVYTTENQEILEDPYEDNDSLLYASYEPEDKEKHPLIIWLHGFSEGGSDTHIAVMGNKVTALVDEEIQGLMGGAYVLVPQAPTQWMNTNGVPAGLSVEMDADSMRSIYTDTLIELIQKYVEEHPGIDQNRIYIGGCSNGGYMTMNLLFEKPDYFAAAYPVCEAYEAAYISDEQLESIQDVPIWFTHCAEDTLVQPDIYTIPTYERVKKAGADNLHFTYWNDVHDTSGEFLDETGTPEKYFGHFSWMYVLNNQCTVDNDYEDGNICDAAGTGETLFQWLAEQSN